MVQPSASAAFQAFALPPPARHEERATRTLLERAKALSGEWAV